MLLALLAALCAAVAFGLAAMLQAVAAREEPDAVGIDPLLLLHLLRRDRVRDRAGPLVVLGLVPAVSGCAALARRDPTLVS